MLLAGREVGIFLSAPRMVPVGVSPERRDEQECEAEKEHGQEAVWLRSRGSSHEKRPKPNFVVPFDRPSSFPLNRCDPDRSSLRLQTECAGDQAEVKRYESGWR